MNKGLKELKRLPNAIKDTFKDSFDIIKKELKSKEKTDKALEIVKTLFHGRCKLYERTEYAETCNEAGCHAEKVATTSYILEFRNYDLQYEFHLDREEYDLLKEVFYDK